MPDASDTLLAALSLAAAGHDQATFDAMVSWLAANVDTVTGTGHRRRSRSTGYLLLVVAAAHGDATDFGGVDLVARLAATLGRVRTRALRQLRRWAIPPTAACTTSRWPCSACRRRAGRPAAAAVDWLAAQQCGGSAEFDGAWMSYRAPKVPADPADPLTPCTAFDSGTFTGIDTNSTALAYEALRAVGRTPAHDALAWLARTQNSDGSFGFYVGNDGDPNSTGLVIQAIVAGGQSPTDPTWAKGADTPLSALSGFQLGCDAAARRPGRVHLPGQRGSAPACWPPSRRCGARPRPRSRSAPCRSPTHRCRASRPPRPPRVRRAPRPRPAPVLAAAAAPVDAAPAFTG